MRNRFLLLLFPLPLCAETSDQQSKLDVASFLVLGEGLAAGMADFSLMIIRRFALFLAALVFAFSASAFAQFGGRPGDVVIYAVTANGSGDFQVVPPSTTNSLQNVGNFRITSSDSVPVSASDPFAFRRRVLYEKENELFQLVTEDENAVGLHRIFLVPTKLFIIQGLNRVASNLLGITTNYVTFPKDLDVQGEVILQEFTFLLWAPKNWPPIVLTDSHGPLRPPDVTGFETGFEYLAVTPGLLQLPPLIPWTNLNLLFPGGSWPDGVDVKVIDANNEVGNTTQILRLRPGRQTPAFRIPGHTHLFVLQGSATITPAGGGAFTMNKHDYAFLPENFAVTLSNPAQYTGPCAQ